MIERTNIDFSISPNRKNPLTVGVQLSSYDRNFHEFEISFLEKELKEGDTVNIFSVFESSKRVSESNTEIRGGSAFFSFDTTLIDRDEVVTNYVHLKSGNSQAEIGAFRLNVKMSEIDKGAKVVAEAYDESYESLIQDFEKELGDYLLKLEAIDQEESIRQDEEEVRKLAETDRISSEGTRKTAESVRVSNESARKNAETERTESEEVRELAENERITNEEVRELAENERESKEGVRKSSEAERLTSETSRINAESKRASNETDRIDSEDKRSGNEEARASAESQRELNEDERSANELNRISEESKRATAEELRKTSEEARETSESTRITAESVRDTKETERQLSESVRETSESTRITAESVRDTKETERQLSESVRDSSEEVRVSNETERINSEDGREVSEAIRVTSESQRELNEDGRISSEQAREINENERNDLYTLVQQKLENGEFVGEKGDTGDGLEYVWNGTQLGVRKEGETEYVYVDLKGDKGDAGEIENLESSHIVDALGYMPISETDVPDPTWANLQNKPTEFNPTSHTHGWSEVTNKPSTFAPSTHTHSINDVTGLRAELDSIPELTKENVGLDNVDNVKQASKAEFDGHNNDATRHITSVERTKWNAVDNKVDKVAGKGLSANDYTTVEKNKLSGIATGAQVNTVTSVAGRTGAVTVSKSDVGLSNVDNLSAGTIRGGTTKANVGLSNVDNLSASSIRSGTTKAHVGLSNVDNVKQMPISGGVLENYREKLLTVSSANGAINIGSANVFTHRVSSNTNYSISRTTSGVAESFTLVIMTTSTVRTLNFPSSVKWQGGEIPDLSTANTTYVLTFMTVDGGSNWLGMFGGEF